MITRSLIDWIETVEDYLPPLRRERRARKLALQIEEQVRELNHLPPMSVNQASHSLLEVLKSTHTLMERLVNNPNLYTPPKQDLAPVRAEPPSEQSLPLPMPVPLEAPLEPELSSTAQELIKLRDWVLMAKSENHPPGSEMLEVLYQRLGQILEKEDVLLLEATGSYNYERQQVITTKPTDDPDRHDQICETVRPGYLFHDKLVRPQEVIIYIYDGSAAPQAELTS
jgi:hypothetical protein